jgi:hypothetical protein
MNTKPKALRYADAFATVEQQIVDALPAIIDGLIARAREGDTKAAVYLCDRILGRVAGSTVPPADDRRAPFTDDDFLLEQKEQEEDKSLRRMLAGFGARDGA